jgi:hypothetical protein
MAIDQRTSQTQGVGQYADVNGINLYYETHGAAATAFLDAPDA